MGSSTLTAETGELDSLVDAIDSLADDPATVTAERTELTQFRRQDVAIAALVAKYSTLTISGINDTAGFKAVHAARMEVKGYRVKVEKKRKELKAEALEYGRTVDTEAARLTKPLEDLEDQLASQEKAVTEEKERIKRAQEEAKAKIVKDRVDALVALGATPNPITVAGFTEEQFQTAITAATEAKVERERLAEVERARLAAEAEARRIESEKLAAERAELDKVRRAQEAEARKLADEQAQLKAEQAKVEAKAAEHRRAIELENAKRESAERARVETERRMAEEQARKEREAAAQLANKLACEKLETEAREAERLRAEREKPYRDKLLAIVEIMLAIQVPDGPASDVVREVINEAADQVRVIARRPLGVDSDLEELCR